MSAEDIDVRHVRREMAGAWRSLRYDLNRRPVPEPGEPTTEAVSQLAGYPEYKPRRRLLAATVCGVLSVAGAAGAYFGVTGGLSALAGDDPAGRPDGLPAVAGPSPSGVADQPAPGPAATASPVDVKGARKPSPHPTKPGVTAPKGQPAASPSCACETPPVPRPTSPAPPSRSPSPEPSVTPPVSPSPSPSTEPSGGPHDPPPTG